MGRRQRARGDNPGPPGGLGKRLTAPYVILAIVIIAVLVLSLVLPFTVGGPTGGG